MASTGFSADVDRQLIEIANLATCPEYEKYVILLMDEMHIKEDIAFDKHTGNCDYCHSFQNGIVIVIISFHIAIYRGNQGIRQFGRHQLAPHCF